MEDLFKAKPRNFKCPQQPDIMDLYFDNNLNHQKELEMKQLS